LINFVNVFFFLRQKKPAFRLKAAKKMKNGKTNQAVRLVYRSSTAARQTMLNLVIKSVNQQASRFVKKSSSLKQPFSRATLHEFDVQALVDELEKELPILVQVLVASICPAGIK
jgi:hypothetical protein